ncbi:hypothetical protein [Ralstonia sp. NFACC01]|uniref:hypothetical protein n=1 Tax=Ralstonia sp. NFACC01 TaxID=1566294 RepID=UPI0008F006CC|nr:hypothetical protein [Ralstonia sp. NFACC01]SFQ19024.1 hypothetical protein SAMN03159417_04540 [Ralstonia sp. NFACC01]
MKLQISTFRASGKPDQGYVSVSGPITYALFCFNGLGDERITEVDAMRQAVIFKEAVEKLQQGAAVEANFMKGAAR